MMCKSSLELDQARHFMRWVTGEDFSPVDKPDCTRAPRAGGHPDYIFRDSRGQEYALELTRLLTQELRKLEQFVENSISGAVQSSLPGTYILRIPLADPRGKGRIDPVVANSTVQELMGLLQSHNLKESQRLSTGFDLIRVRDDGNRLVPWVTAPKLPYDLAVDHAIAKELEGEFFGLISEADHKFKDYGGLRVLLVNISQSGLDLEFHAQRFRDSQGIMLTWAENVSRISTNVDSICLEPGVRVWEADGDRVLAGHKYIESKAGYYVELWHRLGISRLLR